MAKARAEGFNPARIKLTGAIVYKTLDMSTSHVTAGDNDLLRDGMAIRTEHGGNDAYESLEMDLPTGYAMPYFGGWLIRVMLEEDPDAPALLAEIGFSQAFLNLLALCRVRGFGYLRLDRDGDTIEGLPTFDW